MAITDDLQAFGPGDLVDLFEIDVSPIQSGAALLTYYSGVDANSQPVVFGGTTYSPVPIKMTEMTKRGAGTAPRPLLTIGNITRTASALASLYDDLIGAIVTRKRTFGKYLDGQPAADPTAFVSETYLVNQKQAETREIVTFELSTTFDFQGEIIPARRMYHNLCVWEYKGQLNGDPTSGCRWDPANPPGGGGPIYYDENGNVTTAANDACGKDLNACKLRFGAGASLPIGLFPSLRQK